MNLSHTSASRRQTIRVMTYNVHGCVGTDGKLDESRVADVIAAYDPDVVALQELDVERARSRGINQARFLAQRLGMEYEFHPAMSWASEHYGDAILSRLPMSLVKAGILPTVKSRLAFEPRGALLVKIEVPLGGACLYVLNTHLGLGWDERLAQTRALLSEDWLGLCDQTCHLVFCGDLNALPGSAVHRAFKNFLRDVQHWGWGSRPKATFPSRWPVLRLDYLFIGTAIDVSAVQVPRTELTGKASDHLPLIADLELLINDASDVE